MFINLINQFTVQDHGGEYEKRPLKSLLYYCSEALETKVLGDVIEKQFEMVHYFLLFISWDCSFEESYEIGIINN